MAKLYRIYTEDVLSYSKLADMVGGYGFKGFNLNSITGVWEGTKEDSVVIELLDVDGEGKEYRRRVFDLAKHIKIHLNQQAVLVTEMDVNATLI